MLKRTPLFEAHQKLGARLIEFGGWEMPVQYTSIVDEHKTVRQAAGIFDISHMGEFVVSGVGALDFLNSILTNDARKLEPGKGQYTLLCNPSGGTIDDLYLYCLGRGSYLLIVNASRIEADFEWIQAQREKSSRPESIFLQNVSDSYGAVAIQGPAVPGFINSVFPNGGDLQLLAKNDVQTITLEGDPVYLARTGYTGEEGFEIVAPAHLIEKIWWRCLEVGKPAGIKPCGLGARDTLRTEVCYPLYGHELDATTSPIEAGLGFFVALEKGDFIGREVLQNQKVNGPAKRLIAFKMTGKSAPPRPDYPIWSAEGDKQIIGKVTSGTQSPTLNLGLGLGYVSPEHAKLGNTIEIEIRGKNASAVITQKPFYKKPVPIL